MRLLASEKIDFNRSLQRDILFEDRFFPALSARGELLISKLCSSKHISLPQ
jgi:hypothetical protein